MVFFLFVSVINYMAYLLKISLLNNVQYIYFCSSVFTSACLYIYTFLSSEVKYSDQENRHKLKSREALYMFPNLNVSFGETVNSGFFCFFFS